MNSFNPYSKYHSKRVVYENQSFASQLERDVFAYLCLLKKAGKLLDIQSQSHVKLTAAQITYIADFKLFMKDGSVEFAEAKGFETDVWRIKRRLWLHYGPSKLTVFKKKGNGVIPFEVLIPCGVCGLVNSCAKSS